LGGHPDDANVNVHGWMSVGYPAGSVPQITRRNPYDCTPGSALPHTRTGSQDTSRTVSPYASAHVDMAAHAASPALRTQNVRDARDAAERWDVTRRTRTV